MAGLADSDEDLHDAQEQYHDQNHGQSASAQDCECRNINICIADRDEKQQHSSSDAN
jgi:hypothetical protein